VLIWTKLGSSRRSQWFTERTWYFKWMVAVCGWIPNQKRRRTKVDRRERFQSYLPIAG